MGVLYERVMRPILFRWEAEKAHDLGTTALDYLSRLRGVCNLMAAANQPAGVQPISLWGLNFPNHVGLAAGMDKDARFWRVGSALGFGHVEVGTVTAQPQPGNPRPRLFRLVKDRALINRMGFNNEGAEAMATRLKQQLKKRPKHAPILGINIGKTKVVRIEDAVGDYLTSFNLLAGHADYLVVNVSSPNTPDLRQLQSKDHLHTLLSELMAANHARAKRLGGKLVPIVVKIAPDLSFREIDEVLETVDACGIQGLIATNTTLARPGHLKRREEAGGLSGEPLHRRAVDVVNYICRATNYELPVIGVGGVDGPRSAAQMLDAGARLVQFYTGLVFRGPFLAAEIARALAPRQRPWVG